MWKKWAMINGLAIASITASAAEIDLQAKALPPGFHAQSADRVSDALGRIDLQQGKFESKVKFDERMKGLANSPLVDDLKISNRIAFVAPVDSTRISYDPDQERFEFKVSPTGLDSTGVRFQGIEIFVQQLDYKLFPAENSYFEEKYKKIRHTRSVLLEISSLKGLTYIRGSVKVPAKIAAKIDKDLAVVFIGKLKSPYRYTEKILPFKYDQDTMKHREILPFAPDGIWLVNLSTGDILTKAYTAKRDL